jgi:TetR/AcrR family transcriptional regulator
MTDSIPIHPHGDRADNARRRILDAATREFSANGLAGARTERIAEAAGVNKALLYYYFRSKEALYAAALEAVFERVRAASAASLEADVSVGERFLQVVLSNFDRSHSYPDFRSLIQHEMVRLHRGEETQIGQMAEKFFRPLWVKIEDVLEEGIASGELIRADPSQMRYAALGANVLYFLCAPLTRLAFGTDPMGRSELEQRRKAAIEYLGQTIFVDREHGARLAARVLAETPMPQYIDPPTDQSQKVIFQSRNIEAAQTSAIEVRNK